MDKKEDDKPSKKKQQPKATETPIRLRGEFFDKMLDTHPDFAVLKKLFKRKGWPPNLRWWLGRILDGLEREGKIYHEKRHDIINENAPKWEEDGSFKSSIPTRIPFTDEDGNERIKFEYRTINYKEGDIKQTSTGQIDWEDQETRRQTDEALKELQKTEILLRFWKIAIDVSDIPEDVPPEELRLLVDILEVPSIDDELQIPDEKFEEFLAQ